MRVIFERIRETDIPESKEYCPLCSNLNNANSATTHVRERRWKLCSNVEMCDFFHEACLRECITAQQNGDFDPRCPSCFAPIELRSLQERIINELKFIGKDACFGAVSGGLAAALLLGLSILKGSSLELIALLSTATAVVGVAGFITHGALQRSWDD